MPETIRLFTIVNGSILVLLFNFLRNLLLHTLPLHWGLIITLGNHLLTLVRLWLRLWLSALDSLRCSSNSLYLGFLLLYHYLSRLCLTSSLDRSLHWRRLVGSNLPEMLLLGVLILSHGFLHDPSFLRLTVLLGVLRLLVVSSVIGFLLVRLVRRRWSDLLALTRSENSDILLLGDWR